MAVAWIDVDVRVKFDYSIINGSRDIRAVQCLMGNDERRANGGGLTRTALFYLIKILHVNVTQYTLVGGGSGRDRY